MRALTSKYCINESVRKATRTALHGHGFDLPGLRTFIALLLKQRCLLIVGPEWRDFLHVRTQPTPGRTTKRKQRWGWEVNTTDPLLGGVLIENEARLYRTITIIGDG
ncbi:hypothetical protein TRAPUB_13320 [Trametes pubescens]|uniref:Uncharacterized protein n=1 Tax=Trametes pubescens TaxID=154538 RepID=A0A1M2VRJ9_TRAPU|nr:hypothetical protein TRAPUB_13320 [Trametes pubescens]